MMNNIDVFTLVIYIIGVILSIIILTNCITKRKILDREEFQIQLLFGILMLTPLNILGIMFGMCAGLIFIVVFLFEALTSWIRGSKY